MKLVITGIFLVASAGGILYITNQEVELFEHIRLVVPATTDTGDQSNLLATSLYLRCARKSYNLSFDQFSKKAKSTSEKLVVSILNDLTMNNYSGLLKKTIREKIDKEEESHEAHQERHLPLLKAASKN